jgi:hypothetical protein
MGAGGGDARSLPPQAAQTHAPQNHPKEDWRFFRRLISWVQIKSAAACFFFAENAGRIFKPNKS